MKKKVLLFFAVAVSLTVTAQQKGKVLESCSIESKILTRKVNYSVYLPADYDISSRRYPVLYLLNGLGGDETNWVQVGEVRQIADRLIESGESSAMIIVMPDGQDSWYLNDYAGKNRYEDMFMQELIPYVAANYRVRDGKNFCAISGLSMGGYGSLLYAMRHPDVFGSCIALSAAVFVDEDIEEASKRYIPTLRPKLTGPDTTKGVVIDHWRKNSILYLAENMPDGQKKKVRFYIDCGDDDFLYKGNSMLHITMRQQEIPHEYRVRDGGHSWDYWRSGLEDALRFATRSFRFQK